MNVEELFCELSSQKEVEAIALGGSRATEKSDAKSDYDVYVYIKEEIPMETRREILHTYCNRMEIGNHYWELEDNCTLKNGIDIDIIYRKLGTFSGEIKAVVEDGSSKTRYTTCMWHNLNTCKILYDKEGKLKRLQEKYHVPYPKKLKDSIIKKNMNLLSGCFPSYDLQIEKAVLRGDQVSVNHRVTEFLASYFDVIFALNEKTHPGEKRLVKLCKEQCEQLPKGFEENLEELFRTMFQGDVSAIIQKMVEELKKIAE